MTRPPYKRASGPISHRIAFARHQYLFCAEDEVRQAALEELIDVVDARHQILVQARLDLHQVVHGFPSIIHACAGKLRLVNQ